MEQVAQVDEKFRIKGVKAREILDSRGNPTVEVEFFTGSGIASAMVPSGASTGSYEALELRDGDKNRFRGKGVLKAVSNVNKLINPKIQWLDSRDQGNLDNQMCVLDGTPNKSKLGANAILGVSMAVCRGAAQLQGIPLYKHLAHLAYEKQPKKYILPVPSFNIINGGAHGGNNLAVQEFMIMPVGCKTFADALRAGSETYHELKDLLGKKYGKTATNVGDEGGFAPPLNSATEALDFINQAINNAGYKGKVKIALDCAASEFFANGIYTIDGKTLVGDQLVDYYGEFFKKYPIVSIEDPFAEDDFASFAKLTKKYGSKIQVVGDDLLVTNPSRIMRGIDYNACNALLLKVNQIGTVTEAINAALLARKNKWGVMVSHRSGETADTFIADLVVGLGTGQIKSGAPCRYERLSKYNELLRIEEELGRDCVYAGNDFRKY